MNRTSAGYIVETIVAIIVVAAVVGLSIWGTAHTVHSSKVDESERELREFCSHDRNKDTAVCKSFFGREQKRERRERQTKEREEERRQLEPAPTPSPFPR